MPWELKDAAFAIVGWACSFIAILLAVLGRRLRRRSDSGERRRRGASWLCWLASLPLATAGGYGLWVRYRPQPPPLQQTLFDVARYQRLPRLEPRPHVVHVVTVDLGVPGSRFVVTPLKGSPCRPAATTSSFLDEYQLNLAVNTQYFRSCEGAPPASRMEPGFPVAPVGYTVFDGETIVRRVWLGSTLWVDTAGRLSLGERPPQVRHAISGRFRLVRAGRATGATDDSVQPRVALGLDRRARTLLVVVVDGRQRGYSEGISLEELSEILLEHGAWDAVEMDGGGSSTLVVRGEDGRPRVLNSPIHMRIPGRERPVASHLGVQFEPVARSASRTGEGGRP